MSLLPVKSQRATLEQEIVLLHEHLAWQRLHGNPIDTEAAERALNDALDALYRLLQPSP